MISFGFAAIMWSYIGHLLIYVYERIHAAMYKFIDSTLKPEVRLPLLKNILFSLRVIGVLITLAVILINVSYYSIIESGYIFEQNTILKLSGFIIK